MHAAPGRCVAPPGDDHATCTRFAAPNARDSGESLLLRRTGCTITRQPEDNPHRAELRHRLLQMILRNEARRRVHFDSNGV